MNATDRIVRNIEAVCGKPLQITYPAIENIAGKLAPLKDRVNEAIGARPGHWKPFGSLDALDSKREYIKAAAHFFPADVFSLARLIAARPPDDIHRMQRSDPYWVGDFFSANMIIHALKACRLLGGNQSVLDIGCSSGSLVRVLAAFDDSWHLHGRDPIASAVLWASDNLPIGSFGSMETRPPLDFENAALDGVTAISVWSHHRPDAAQIWIDEIARVLKPGGWFAVTFSCLHSVRWLAVRRKAAEANLDKMLQAITDTGNHFVPVKYEREDSDTDVDWGQSCYSRERFFGMFRHAFDVAGYFPGLNQGNQDLAVFVRT